MTIEYDPPLDSVEYGQNSGVIANIDRQLQTRHLSPRYQKQTIGEQNLMPKAKLMMYVYTGSAERGGRREECCRR